MWRLVGRMAVSVLALAGVAATVGGPASSRAGGPTLVTVGVRPELPRGAVILGPLAGTAPLALRLLLRPRDAAALQDFATEVSSPGSGLYRQYLRKGAFAARYGPTEASVRLVTSALDGLGLRPTAISSDHLELSVATTASAVERALSVRISRYRLASGRVVFASASAPSVPRRIASFVTAIVGLDDLGQGQPADGGGAPARPGARPLPVVTASGPKACATAAHVGAATAATLASAYGLTGLYGRGDLGSGQTIALFEAGAFNPTNVKDYQSCYGTHAAVKTVAVDGGVPIGDGTLEATADVEDIIGLAPKATVVVYETANLFEPNWLDEWTRIVDDDTAGVVSTSWLACEPQPGGSFLQAEDTLLQQAAAQGQTVLAASGDYGSEACDQFDGSKKLSVNDAASQPFVTGVGGTQWTGPSRSGETAWNAGEGAGGGGLSSVWPMPSWQKGPGVDNAFSSGAPCKDSKGDCREVPDVAALSGAPFYTFLCTRGDCSGVNGWGYFWGTSFATPLWAAAVALSDEGCAAPPAGFLDPALYALAASTPTAFHDIRSGDNDFTGSHHGDYPATKGYDLATGLGTPELTGSTSALASGLCRMATPSSITLTGGPAAVETSTHRALSLRTTARETFAGAHASTAVGVALSAGGGEQHVWSFRLPAGALAERGGRATVSTGGSLGSYGSVRLSFRRQKTTALACSAGSGESYSGKLSGSITFRTGTGWGNVSSTHLTFAGSSTLVVDFKCVARATSAPACVTAVSWRLVAGSDLWSGGSTGATSSEVALRRVEQLSSPKGATRLDAVSVPADALSPASSKGHTVLEVAALGGHAISGSGSLSSGTSVTRHSACTLGGGAHEETAVTFTATWSNGKPGLSARFSAAPAASAPASASASFVVDTYH